MVFDFEGLYLAILTLSKNAYLDRIKVRELWDKWALELVVGCLSIDLFLNVFELVYYFGILSLITVVEEAQVPQLLAAVCEDPLLFRWVESLLFMVD